uniref:Uncharacterized protein n=1 Tax=Sciurus vulgaris TaxID=55149 RepID=A0A8D2DN97_SCIVU
LKDILITDLELLGSIDPPASASQVADTTGRLHHIQNLFFFFLCIFWIQVLYQMCVFLELRYISPQPLLFTIKLAFLGLIFSYKF